MAYSLINHTAKEGSSVTVTTNAIDTTGATLIVVVLATGAQALVSITDTGNNLWYYNDHFQQSTQDIAFAFCVNPVTNASHTFTLTQAFPSVAVLVFSGNAAGSEKTTASGANSTTVTPGSITPAEDDALLIAGFCGGAATTQSISGGFTISDQIGGSSGQRVAAAYLIQTSKTAANPTWTNSASANISAMLGSFPLQTSGGGGGGGEVSVVF